jgi:hypothetical protein
MGARLWTMRWQQWNRWSFTVRPIPEARRRFAVPDYLFAASFGSRYSAQAWKKELLVLDPLLQPPCARLTRNIWPDCDRRLSGSATHGQGGARTPQPSDPISKDEMRSYRTTLSQPLPHRDAKRSGQGRSHESESLMGSARLRRIPSRTSKSKGGAQRPSKHYKTLPCAMPHDDDATQFESTHSLLLSSLRYWEVERDLIEERIAAFRSLTRSFVR